MEFAIEGARDLNWTAVGLCWGRHSRTKTCWMTSSLLGMFERIKSLLLLQQYCLREMSKMVPTECHADGALLSSAVLCQMLVSKT